MNTSPNNPICTTCGGTTRSRMVTYEQTVGNEHVLVTGVPAYVCTQCGDSHFDFQVAAQLEKLLDTGAPVRTVETPVYEFPATAVPA